jgi:hypothetical protein
VDFRGWQETVARFVGPVEGYGGGEGDEEVFEGDVGGYYLVAEAGPRG